jgi:predicted  nucleic acid-binding Zn-ribbon protein
MKAIKSTLILALIFCLCASLSGTLFVLTASAQITPKKVDEPTKFYQIREGDTLGGLSKEYRSDSRLWRDFEKYNIFANPNLIYPYEELQVPASWLLPGDPRGEKEQEEPVAREATGLVLETPSFIIEDSVTTADFEAFRDEFDSYRNDLNSAITELGGQVDELRRQNEALQGGIDKLQNATESNAGAVADLSEALKANEKKIVSLSKQVTTLQEGLDQNGVVLRKWHDRTEALNSRVDSLAQEIGAIKNTQDKILVELEDFLQPAPPEPSKKTRTFAILTVLAGGAAWLAVNAVGGRD